MPSISACSSGRNFLILLKMKICWNIFWWLLAWLVFWIFILSTYPHYLGNSISVPQKPSSKVGQSADLIRCVMKSSNYCLHDGCIYKKLEECKYIYIYCTSVTNYLLNVLGNFEIADITTPRITQLTSLLSEPACRLLEPIR